MDGSELSQVRQLSAVHAAGILVGNVHDYTNNTFTVANPKHSVHFSSVGKYLINVQISNFAHQIRFQYSFISVSSILMMLSRCGIMTHICGSRVV